MFSKEPQNEHWSDLERLIQAEKIIMEIETGKSLNEVTTKYNTKFKTAKSESSIKLRYQSLLRAKKEVDNVRLSLLLF